jgi:hypothetical protein
VIERATSQLGHHGYDLKDDSGGHFATWCATGDSVGDKVRETEAEVTTRSRERVLRSTLSVTAVT